MPDPTSSSREAKGAVSPIPPGLDTMLLRVHPAGMPAMSGTATAGSQETAGAANAHHGWAGCQQHCPACVQDKTRHLSSYMWCKAG